MGGMLTGNTTTGITVTYQDADGTIDLVVGGLTAAELAADSVSAEELNATGVESELEAVLDLQDLQGAVTDAQVPDLENLSSNCDAGVPVVGDGAGNADCASGESRLIFTQTADSGITAPDATKEAFFWSSDCGGIAYKSNGGAVTCVVEATGSFTMTGTYDIGGGTLEIPNGAAPTTDAVGEIAVDNNAWATGRGAGK